MVKYASLRGTNATYAQHTHKAVTSRVEAKKLLFRRRQLNYSENVQTQKAMSYRTQCKATETDYLLDTF